MLKVSFLSFKDDFFPNLKLLFGNKYCIILNFGTSSPKQPIKLYPSYKTDLDFRIVLKRKPHYEAENHKMDTHVDE